MSGRTRKQKKQGHLLGLVAAAADLAAAGSEVETPWAVVAGPGAESASSDEVVMEAEAVVVAAVALD